MIETLAIQDHKASSCPCSYTFYPTPGKDDRAPNQRRSDWV